MHRKSLTIALFSALLCLGALRSFGAPFARTFDFTQPDGAAIRLWGEGDEFRADFETLDGFTVVFDHPSRAYHYAARSADGAKLVSSGGVVGRDDPKTLGLVKHLRADEKAARTRALERFNRWNAATRNSERWRARKAALRSLGATAATTAAPALPAPPTTTTTGTRVGLCLLIDFDDDTNTVSRAEIIDFCNGEAYAGYGNNGSVKAYFRDNSNSLLTYTNIVTVYVRIPNSLHPKSYYNDTDKDCGDQANELIRDAIALLKDLPNYASEIAPAFAGLTRDGSGRVQACNVFYAGGNGGVWAYGLWPHSWSLYNVGAQTLTAGVSVYDYQISNIGSSLEIGTFCHENGHMLCGYPDIYDYDYDSTGGGGLFCLMNSGGYGVNPVQICAYLKRASGWATTTELTSASDLTATVTSSAGAGFNAFYRYEKPGTATEYYLVENRQKAGRDANIPGSGVAVWHIDELGDRDNQSTNYNTSHANYEVTLVQADDLRHFQSNANSGDASDLFYSGNTADGYLNVFSDDSAPSARWWDGTGSGVNFSSFSASGPTMTFRVRPPGLMIVTGSPLPSGTVGQPYSKPLAALGGAVPYAWSVTSNALPDGLALVGGVITGTPTTVGTTLFVLQVTDQAAATDSALFSLTVRPPRSVPYVESFESWGALPEGWTQQYVTNATPWSFPSGGASEVPAAAHSGQHNALFFRGDKTAPRTKLISPMIDFGPSPNPAVLTFWHCMADWDGDQDKLRVFYRTTPTGEWIELAAYATDTPSWTYRTLVLPNPGRTYFIAFEGEAQYGYGVCVDDVSVLAGGEPPAIATPGELPLGIAGAAYREALLAYGGTPPYAWSVVSNAPPPGLSLSAAGLLSGTPAEPTNALFQIRVSDSAGKAATNLFSLTVYTRRPIPFVETFESGGGMPAYWHQEFVTNAASWTFQSGGYKAHPAGPHGGSYNALLFYGSAETRVTRLVSPAIDFGAAAQNAQLTFWHCMASWEGDQDELRVYFKSSPTQSWQQVAAYTSDAPAWVQRTVALPSPGRLSFIAFEGHTRWGYGVCVDDVSASGDLSPYGVWQTNQFTAAELAAGVITGDADDPDGDGVANLLEYAMGLNPRAADPAGAPAGGVWGPYLTLRYRQSKQATDVAVAVESCTNLAGAVWVGGNVSELSRADSNLWWLVTAKHDVPVTNAPSRFMRLKVSRP